MGNIDRFTESRRQGERPPRTFDWNFLQEPVTWFLTAIAGMLIAFLALIAMLNGILGFFFHISLQEILGKMFAPVAWLLGVKYNDCPTIGSLLGTRLVLNEFIAFQALGPLQPQLDPRSFIIATYALCGFANLSSIAIQIGGIGALAPNRKSDLARLGLKAVMAGTLANFMTACIAGMLI